MKMNPSRHDTLTAFRDRHRMLQRETAESRRDMMEYALLCVERGETLEHVQEVIGADHNLAAHVDEKIRLAKHQARKAQTNE